MRKRLAAGPKENGASCTQEDEKMNPKFKKSTLKIGGGILLTIALALAAKEGYKAFTNYMQDEMGKSAAEWAEAYTHQNY